MMKKTFLLISVLLLAGRGWADLPVTQDLILHLAGDVVTSSGGAVTAWPDQSGLGNDALPKDSSYNPALEAGVANGNDAVDFSGSKALVVASSTDFDSSALTFLVVYKLPDNPNTTSLLPILCGSHDMGYNSGEFNHSGVRMTWGLTTTDGKLKAHCLTEDGVWAGEMIYPFRGFTGWNLAIGVWDAAEAGSNLVLDGNFDMYLNPGSTDYPTLADALSQRWYEGSDSSGTPYTLANHIMTVIGGRPNYAIGPYPGTYSIGDFSNGMVAEVIVYNAALTDCEIAPLVTYLQQKYACGEEPPLLNVTVPGTDCRYWTDTGKNMASDLTGDCMVDLFDFAEVASQWMTSYGGF